MGVSRIGLIWVVSALSAVIVLGLVGVWSPAIGQTAPVNPQPAATIEDLLILAKSLTGTDEATVLARIGLADHITQRYMSSADAAKSVTLAQWKELAQSLGGDMPAEQRLLWAQRLREAYPDRAAGAANSAALSQIVQLLGVAPQLVASVTSQGARASIDDLLWLSRLPIDSNDTGWQVKQQIAEYLMSQYMADAGAVRSVGIAQWQQFSTLLARDITADAKSVWAGKLRSGFTASPEVMAGLALQDLVNLVGVLRTLGDDDAAGVPAAYVQANTVWKTWGLSDLLKLTGTLSGGGSAAVSGRLKIAQYVQDTYLASANETRAVGCANWQTFVQYLGRDISLENRAIWRKQLRAAFAGSAAAVTSLKDRDAIYLVSTLAQLGDLHVSGIVATWVNGTTAWQSLEVADMITLARNLENDHSIASDIALKSLTENVNSRFMTAQAVKTVPLAYWSQILQYMGKDLSAENRVLWTGILMDAYAKTDQDIAALKTNILAFLQVMTRLDSAKAADVAVQWLTDRAAWKQLGPTTLASVITYAFGSPKADKAALMDAFDKTLADKTKLNWQECSSIAYAWSNMGNQAKAREWAMSVYQRLVGTDEARKAVDSESLQLLDKLLRKVRLLDGSQTFPEYTQALLDMAYRGALYPDDGSDRAFADILMATKNDDTVKAQLTDPNGMPRIALGRILTLVYRNQKSIEVWLDELDSKIADAVADKDAKAMWLVLRADAAVQAPTEVSFRQAFGWLNKALAEAQSEPVRWSVIYEIVSRYRSNGLPRVAFTMLESLKGQLSADKVDQITALEAQLQREIQVQADKNARIAASNARVRQQSLLDYHQKRLAIARGVGDQQAANRIAAAITALEKEMTP